MGLSERYFKWNNEAWEDVANEANIWERFVSFYDDEPVRLSGDNLYARTQEPPSDCGLRIVYRAAETVEKYKEANGRYRYTQTAEMGKGPSIRDEPSPYELMMIEQETADAEAAQEIAKAEARAAKRKAEQALKDKHDALAALTEIVYGRDFLPAFERWWFNNT